MTISGLERYNVTLDDRANKPFEQLGQLREAMIVAKDRYDYLEVDIMAEDHDLAAVARDVIQAHANYTRYRTSFAGLLN